MKSLITFILAVISMSFTFGASITGTVKQKQSNDVLSGVVVTLNESQFVTISNSEGHFSFVNIPPGTYILKTSYLGFTNFETLLNTGNEEIIELTIKLEESVIALPEALVKSYSMTGGMTQRMDIPGSAYYLPLRELKRFDYTDPNRVLSSIPGVQIQEEDGFGLRPNIGFRGSGTERSSKITVMEDGVLAAPAPYTAPAAYYFPTIARMHGIEILKGSSQIEYGPFTTGGALNLISAPIPEDFAGSISLSEGSYGYRKTLAELGMAHENVGIMAQFLNQGSNGFKNLPTNADTGFDKKDYLIKARLQTNSSAQINQIFSFKWGHATEKSNETYLGLTQSDFALNPLKRYAGSQKDQMNTQQSQFSVRHTLIGLNNWSVSTTAYLQKFSRNWYKLYKVNDAKGSKQSISKILKDPDLFPYSFSLITGQHNGDGLHVRANNRSYNSKGIQSVFRKSFFTHKVKHDIKLGFRYHFDEVDRFQWVDAYEMRQGSMAQTNAGAQGSESNRLESAHAIASYISYKIQAGKFTFHPGLRNEVITMERLDYGKEDLNRTGIHLASRKNRINAWIPGIGVDYRITNQSRLFTGIHRGFAPPGSQPEALPESSINYELGWRQTSKTVNFESVIFYSDYQNLLGSDLAASGGTGSTSLFNGGAASTFGVELQMSYDFTQLIKSDHINLPVQVNYTFTEAAFDHDFDSTFEGWGEVSRGDELPYLAKHRLNCQLAAEHPRWSVSMQWNFVSQMRATAGQGKVESIDLIPEHSNLDLSATYVISNAVVLKGGIYNVFNQTYLTALRPAGFRPGLPRMFQAGLQVGF